MSQRWKIVVEFDGRPFCGWQRQAHALSVQECLETALAPIAGEALTLHAAGRTDSGVHAQAMPVSFAMDRAIEPHKLQAALNFHLRPHPIAVLAAERAAADFHARFSCIGRSYRYRIINRRAPLALDAGRAWLAITPLDAEAMAEAAHRLVGKHDFSTFRAGSCQARDPVKTLSRLEVQRLGEEVHIIAEARSFLHHQVRNMTGALRLVGEGRWTPDDMERALIARDRRRGGPTAPPDGLYFTGADYP
jgi:tRNA pseudouridine38-40 synthase